MTCESLRHTPPPAAQDAVTRLYELSDHVEKTGVDIPFGTMRMCEVCAEGARVYGLRVVPIEGTEERP